MGSLVEPFDDVSIRVENHTASAISPAHVSDRNEERRGQPIQLPYLATAESKPSGKSHRSDVQPIRFFQNARFELRERRIGTHIIDTSEQLSLGEVISGGAVATDGNANEARATTFTLGLPDRVQNAGTHTLNVPVRPFALDLHRKTVLGAHILAAFSLQYEPHL